MRHAEVEAALAEAKHGEVLKGRRTTPRDAADEASRCSEKWRALHAICKSRKGNDGYLEESKLADHALRQAHLNEEYAERYRNY